MKDWQWVDGKYTSTLVTNQLITVPAELSALKNLKNLDISGNPLTTIPRSVLELPQLKSLTLISVGLSELPEAIASLTNLTELSLWGNQLTEVPAAIANLTNLTTLSLWGNQLKEVPAAIANLTNLTELDLSFNQLTEVPAAITSLTNLTKLDLSRNELSELPDAIASLTNLTSLSLWGNQLVEVPAAIANLTNLTSLDLRSNQLTEVPAAITHLTNLTSLNLRDNNIAEIPAWLEELPDLKTLDLRRNPLPVSPEVLGPSDPGKDPGAVDDIFNYCRQMRGGHVRPLNEAKLILVGQGSVGKTSLIKRLIDHQFDSNEAQTDGLSVRRWSVHVNSKDVRLNVWDFGGQEIYHATHQFFLTKRSLYLLVCNCRTSEDENRIEYWLKLIETFGDSSPVIIVGNKKDEQPFDINRKALRDKYPNIKAILETSCQTNDGIDDLGKAITHEVAQLSDVYNLLPLTWFEVKEHLEAMKQDFISHTAYACICDRKNVLEEHNQEQLITLLHNLGLVLSFRQHPILQNTDVLNPDWVTQGIYTILSDDTLRTQTKGMLTHANLTTILDPLRYPANRHHYLTELMKEFQLCFELSDRTPTTFLIPGLLPKEEPQDTDVEGNLEGDTLEFQYHYRILPESILSRFIVLAHDKIHSETYWRSGVMLAYCEGTETCNLARIKADPEDRKIFIAIGGRDTTRRVFLAIIRDVFNKIHSTFANLEVEEWVPIPGHPDHLLEYEELLGLEDMGRQVHYIGKLKLEVNVRKLLDGYESAEARQMRRMGDRGFDFHDGMHPGIYVNIMQENSDRRTKTTHQHGKGDNFGGDRVQGDKTATEL